MLRNEKDIMRRYREENRDSLVTVSLVGKKKYEKKKKSVEVSLYRKVEEGKDSREKWML